MLIILSDLVNMCKIERTLTFKRGQKSQIPYKKEYIYIGRHYGRLSTGYLEHLSHPSFCKGGAVLEI